MNDLIFKVLDHGFVQVVDKMGTDKTVVNSARLSYSNHSFAEQDMTDKDLRLLGYLAEHKHLSPFRHCYVSFLIRAPEFVMRQWYKHAVGASWFAEGNPDTPWNEASQRFKEVEPVFYEPYEWLAQNTENKQASGKPLHHETQQVCHMVAGHAQRFAWEKYQELLLHGVSREQARMGQRACKLSRILLSCELRVTHKQKYNFMPQPFRKECLSFSPIRGAY